MADSRMLQQEFVKSECGVMAMWGCSHESSSPCPCGIFSGLVAVATVATAGAQLQHRSSKKCLLLSRDVESALWGPCGDWAGCTPTFRVFRRTSHPGILQTAEMWQISGKPQNPRRHQILSLKFLGFRVVTFPRDLRGFHQRDLQRVSHRSCLGSSNIFGCSQSWALCALGIGTESLSLPLIHPKIIICTETSPGRCWFTAIMQRTKCAEAKELS